MVEVISTEAEHSRAIKIDPLAPDSRRSPALPRFPLAKALETLSGAPPSDLRCPPWAPIPQALPPNLLIKQNLKQQGAIQLKDQIRCARILPETVWSSR